MHPKIEEWTRHGPVITDGAWGTEMQARGLGAGECPDLWNLTRPEAVREVAAAYAAAGSRIVLTNTFGANAVRLEEVGTADRVVEINRRGAELSREGVGEDVLVFGSMGPCGKILMMGEVDPGRLREDFEKQAFALAEGGVDALVIETMSDLEEAKLALAAAGRTGLPVVACMVYDSGKDRDRTMMGTTPEEASDVLTRAGADVIGANCGQGVDGFATLCQRLRSATPLPLWLKPNAGLPEVIDGRTRYAATAGDFARKAAALIVAGATFIGGCCGTNPEFIAALQAEIATLKKS